MFQWNKFPYTDFRGVNLDWIIQRVKELSDKMDSLPEYLSEYFDSEEFQANLQKWVENAITDNGLAVPLKMFGAKGDGVTDDSAAFKIAYDIATQAINWAGPYFWGNHTIKAALHLGSGRFVLKTNNPLAIDGAGSTRWGVTIRGDGPFVSQLYLSPETEDVAYFYNQTDTTIGLIAPQFDNMGFVLNPALTGTFFSTDSSTNEASQGFFFDNCLFVGSGTSTLYEARGENNDSEISFTNCRMREFAHIIDQKGSIENVDYFFVNSDLEHIYDHCFVFRTGSHLSVTNCSLLFDNASKAKSAILHMTGDKGTISGGNFMFNNVRVEFHNDSIVYSEDLLTPANIIFTACRLGVAYTDAPKLVLPVNSLVHMTFNNCTLNANVFQSQNPQPFLLFTAAVGNTNSDGNVTFNNCSALDMPYIAKYDGNITSVYIKPCSVTFVNTGDLDFTWNPWHYGAPCKVAVQPYTTASGFALPVSEVHFYGMELISTNAEVLPETIKLESPNMTLVGYGSDHFKSYLPAGNAWTVITGVKYTAKSTEAVVLMIG